jgi:C4-dicarboxylate transporter, DctM subunit
MGQQEVTSVLQGRDDIMAPETLGTGSGAGTAYSAAMSALARAIEVLLVVVVTANVALTFVNMILRNFVHTSIVWMSDFSAVSLSLLTFLGAAAQLRRNPRMMAFTYVVDRVSDNNRDVIRALGCSLVLATAVAVMSSSGVYLSNSSEQLMTVLDTSNVWIALCLVVGFALMGLFAIEQLIALRRPYAGYGLLTAVLLGAVAFGAHLLHERGQLPVNPVLFLVLGGVLGLVAGVPVGFVLALAGISFVFVAGEPLAGASVTMHAGSTSFVLLAIPFFVMLGALMEATGISRRLVDAIDGVVGHVKGGLLMTTIPTTYLFSGISGSKPADIAAIGSSIRSPLKEKGYPPGEGIAILSLSAAMSETVPPSLVMLLMSSVAGLSVSSLFLAGFLPAATLAVALMVGVAIRARQGHIPAPEGRFDGRRAVRNIGLALPGLVTPVILVAGFAFGLATPTELGTLAVVYGIFITSIFYRGLSIRRLWELAQDGALLSGAVLLTMAASGLVTHAVLYSGVVDVLSDVVANIASPLGFMIVSAIILIIMGVALEGMAAVIVFAPILMPLAKEVGINPLHYSIVLIMAMGIGVFSPPFGSGLYTAAAVMDGPVDKAFRPGFFYAGVLVIGLAVVIAFPDLTLVIPRLFGAA